MTTSPTTDQPELLPVIQADIDAAVDLKYALDNAGGTSWSARSGDPEKHPVVQAFARHRLTSTTPTLGDMVMVPREPTEAMIAAWENACPKAGWQALQDMSDAEANAALVHAEWSAMLAAAPASPIPTSVANEGEREWPAMLQGSAAKHAVVCAKLANATPVAGEPDPLWWERQSAIREAAVILAHVAALSPALDNTAVEGQAFRPIETWDERDEPVLLLVDYDDGEHPLDDARYAITIGHNNDHNVGEDEGQGWLFAGWCWSYDHYVQGKGEVVAWMPLPHIFARAWAVQTEKA